MSVFDQRLWANGGLLADACFFRHDGSLGQRLEPTRASVLAALWRWLDLPLRSVARVIWHESSRWGRDGFAPLPWCLFCHETDEGYGLHHRASCIVRAAGLGNEPGRESP